MPQIAEHGSNYGISEQRMSYITFKALSDDERYMLLPLLREILHTFAEAFYVEHARDLI
jgi:hypothetical protein